MNSHTPSPPWVLSLKPYVPGKPIGELQREYGIDDVIKLASNENPLGSGPKAVAAMHAAVASQHLYPDAAAFDLKEALARHAGVDASRIVVGNGSDEILKLLVGAFCTPFHNAVIASDGFIAYRITLGAAGVAARIVPSHDFVADTKAMADACDVDTRLLFIANPNNPTGTLVGAAALRDLIRRVPPHVLVVLDEAYREYVDSDDHLDGLSLLGERENLVVMRTFSKAYGLAGLRVGWAVMPAYAADRLNRIRVPFNVGSIGQAAALAALGDTEFLDRVVSTNRDVRASLYVSLSELGLEFVPSHTNFVMFRSPIGGAELYEALLRQGVIIRPLQPYGMLDHVRVSIGTSDENARFVSALRKVLGR